MERGVLISGARRGTNRLEHQMFWRDESWNLKVHDIYTTRAIARCRAGASWLPALSETYRNLPFLQVASWPLGKKTNTIILRITVIIVTKRYVDFGLTLCKL